MNSPTPQNQSNDADQDKPVGGAIIDEQGREIEITEHMIQDACDELEKSRIADQNKD
ncbi:PA1571 family protein [Pseudomonas sp.]|uniref:PA1571 family protein n=1 Tax=Pseudomonas sp. TaxID=306 RepID=UPI003A96F970